MKLTLSDRISDALHSFGANADLAQKRGLPTYEDAKKLVVVSVDKNGREHQLEPSAAASWTLMERAAQRDGIALHIVSAYRGFDRQVELCRSALASGRSLESTFSTIAPPGCSEHHTGRAIDLGTAECADLSESFEETDAFAWLDRNASNYGYALSFPRNNQWGFIYEPWHWCFDPQLVP